MRAHGGLRGTRLLLNVVAETNGAYAIDRAVASGRARPFCRRTQLKRVRPADQCPLWVISGHGRGANQCPLYPPKADMDQSGCDVRFVPKADSCSATKNGLVDHL